MSKIIGKCEEIFENKCQILNNVLLFVIFPAVRLPRLIPTASLCNSL